MNGDSFFEARIQQLKAMYQVYGREGLKEFSSGDLRLLLSAKQLDLNTASKVLERREGDEAWMASKTQLEMHCCEIGGELAGRTEKSRGRER